MSLSEKGERALDPKATCLAPGAQPTSTDGPELEYQPDAMSCPVHCSRVTVVAYPWDAPPAFCSRDIPGRVA